MSRISLTLEQFSRMSNVRRDKNRIIREREGLDLVSPSQNVYANCGSIVEMKFHILIIQLKLMSSENLRCELHERESTAASEAKYDDVDDYHEAERKHTTYTYG